MRSVIVITFGTRGGPEGRQTAFWAHASGRFGGGYQGAFAGNTAFAAASFARREMVRYGVHRAGGATLIAPPEVLAENAAQA
jgi:hypothetical protein